MPPTGFNLKLTHLPIPTLNGGSVQLELLSFALLLYEGSGTISESGVGLTLWR